MSTTAPAGDPARRPSTEESQPTAPHQLALRLFGVIGAFDGTPPERALWRVLLDLGLGDTLQFAVPGHHVSASNVHHVAWAVYARANEEGIVARPTRGAACAPSRQRCW